MRSRYVVLPRADEDLDEQADYLTVEANIGVALRFLEAAHDTFALLSSHPEMGWQCRLRHPGLASARVFRVKGFEKILIFYRLSRDRIEILRVLHGSQDLEALFEKE